MRRSGTLASYCWVHGHHRCDAGQHHKLPASPTASWTSDESGAAHGFVFLVAATSVCVLCFCHYVRDAWCICVNVLRYKRESLKILGSVGEPINPEAWLWYHNVVGDGHCAIVDTFWQTETVFSSLVLSVYTRRRRIFWKDLCPMWRSSFPVDLWAGDGETQLSWHTSWPAQLATSTFSQLGQYANSPGHRAYCCAEIAKSTTW